MIHNTAFKASTKVTFNSDHNSVSIKMSQIYESSEKTYLVATCTEQDVVVWSVQKVQEFRNCPWSGQSRALTHLKLLNKYQNYL